MKKYIPVVLGCLIVAMIAFTFFRGSDSKVPSPSAEGQQNGSATDQAEARKASDIKIALYDPAEKSSALTQLLESRLKNLGYQVTVTKEIPDPAQAQSMLTTLFLRSGLQASMATLQHTFLNSPVVRQFTNDSFSEDILIATWNVEDINWGDQSAEAQKLAMPDPSSVSIIVYNAGAASGAAGAFVDSLKGEGYGLAAAENTDTRLSGSSIIYYQKGYKEVAKKILGNLKTNGYAERTYRARQDQEAHVVVLLAGTESTTATASSTPQ